MELKEKLRNLREEVFKNRYNLDGFKKTHRVISTGYPEQFIRFSLEYCEVVFGNILWSIMKEYKIKKEDDNEFYWADYVDETDNIIEGEKYLYHVFHSKEKITFID
jgi:hypothetical protein